MAESLINSIARLRVIEKRLLTKELISRLIAAPSYAEAERMLREAGFGSSAQATAAGISDALEALITAHLEETYAIVDELMPKRLSFVTETFRMLHDVTNIKLLYKLRLLGSDIDPAALDLGGVFPGEALKKAVSSGDYSVLPKKIKETLEELDVLTYKNPDAKLVSGKIDGAYFSLGLGSKNGFVREYFSASADFTNLIALIRGSEPSELLPCGEYDEKTLAKIAGLMKDSRERIPELLRTPFDTSPLKAAARAAFEEYLKTGHTAAIEKARDEYLVDLAMKGRSDIDSPAPIVGFMLAREREAEVIRLILTVKRSGIPMSAIDERSVMLYG